MRIALAQVNPTVGDIGGNSALVIEAIASAEKAGASITLLPELVLTGYPPEDLVFKEHFVEENLSALAAVAAACERLALVGFIDRAENRLYNALAVCGSGRVLQVYHKRNLPNYGVFDEGRYFSAGEGVGLTELGGWMFATTVCEDVWVPGPAREAAEQGARVLLNISASPLHAGKGAERERMLVERARENGLWLAYCNMVGGQDELVFDGRSVVISPEGEVIARGVALSPIS